MSAYYIGVHVRASDAAAMRREVAGLFAAEGFAAAGEDLASTVVGREELLPPGEEWYGVIVSGVAGAGWVSVYVADWQDSGALARGLSGRLRAPVLELWVAEDVHWGYAYYEDGAVRDRFADDPGTVADTPEEAAQYTGRAEALAAILQVPPAQLQAFLRRAQSEAGAFAGGPVGTLAQAVGLPFGHAFTGYDYFFEDDPEDYADDLEDWHQFRHLVFTHPRGRESLAE